MVDHRRHQSPSRQKGSSGDSKDKSSRIAHTLTACCRCRNRKTRCDPGLPRCGPCERTNSHCEYFDPTKGARIPRNYVVYLQHRVRDLELELENLEKEEPDPDPEDMMRNAAAVRITEGAETKFLGPSSGITVTRIVMLLAKQFSDSKSITDIVPDARARSIKDRFAQEEAKPTSKVYPLISDVAAEDLPNRDLTTLLVQLFNLKVQPMYPIFHEPTFSQDVEDVYNGSTDPYQNYIVRMVVAISLQKMDTQYAGLADSYYLAALQFFSDAIKEMDLRTLQCFVLVGAYSLLTPTRTGVYYVLGLGVRLCQELGLHEEKTIKYGKNGQQLDPLEIDMRRRLFWSILIMDYGLAHSLGRPSAFAATREHIDVEFFSLMDDQFISVEGIYPAQPSLKKWITQHFYRMRLLQLDIRRKLYLKKRPTPKNDRDPWFKQMEERMVAWRDAIPVTDGGSGLDKPWFTVRYNTMLVFLFRPTPQVPKPSVRAAKICYEACEFNIHLAREQIEKKAIDLTWIFTQTIFMAINHVLWSISYEEVRSLHPREKVEANLRIALESIGLASERWPGVESALELYQNLIAACIKCYDRDGDITINPVGSPAETGNEAPSYVETTIMNGSGQGSPATMSSSSHKTPLENRGMDGIFHSPGLSEISSQPQNLQSSYGASRTPSPPTIRSSPFQSPYQDDAQLESFTTDQPTLDGKPFDPESSFNPLPTNFGDTISWAPTFPVPSDADMMSGPTVSALQGLAANNPLRFDMSMADHSGGGNDSLAPPGPSDYMGFQDSIFDRRGGRLSQVQHLELMQELETQGMGQIENMIEQSSGIFGRPQHVPGG